MNQPLSSAHLLSQSDQESGRFIGDGTCDQAPVYDAVTDHTSGARLIIPPRKDAVLSLRPQRLEVRCTDRFQWKRTWGYYVQAHAEPLFSRFKRIFGDRLRAKRDESQAREVSPACQLLNPMTELG